MNLGKMFFFFLTVAFSLTALGEEVADFFAKADAFYDQGDCGQAIEEYKKLSNPKNSADKKEKIFFRITYCQFALGQFKQSEKGFEIYLKKYPQQQEARLKYAQSLFINGKNSLAQKNAQLVHEQEFKSEASIVEARVLMAESQYQKAIEILSQQKNDEDHKGEVLFWLGAAFFYDDQDEEAEAYFHEAQNFTQPGWLSAECKTWLEQIELNKKRFHLNLVMGAVYDTNLAQGGGSVLAGAGNKPVPSNNYIIDSGPMLQADFKYNWMQKRKSSFGNTLSLYSPFYGNNSSYNSQNLSFDSLYLFQTQSLKNYSLSFKYSETFYNTVYSQDYLILTPSLNWNLTQNFWIKFSLPVTSYLNNKQINIYSLTADSQYSFGPLLQISVGVSAAKSMADAATFSLGPPLAVSTGTVFSRYQSSGGSLGLSTSPTDSLQISALASSLTTNYEPENLPGGGGGNGPKPRTDVTTTYQLSLMQMIRKNFSYLSLSSTNTDNQSTGFLGIATNGALPVNTYTRFFTSLTLSFYF